MKIRALVLAAMISGLAACSGDKAPTPEATTPAPAATEAAATAPVVNEVEAPNNNPIVPPVGPAPIAGTDYVVIENGAPFDPIEGKIEVAEAFGYICPACARFQPLVNAWMAKQPADVNFTYVPAEFGDQWKPYAKAYFAAQALGIEKKSHDAVIQAIHVDGKLPAEGQTPNEQKVADFYAQFGVKSADFLAAMNSFATTGKLNKAKQFFLASGVEGTPTLIVNGKYRITGKTYEDNLRIADHLVAMEREASAAK